MTTPAYGAGIEITGRITPEYAEILTPDAVAFAAKLQRAFGGRRAELLAEAGAAPGRARRRRAAGLPARDARGPRGRLDLRTDRLPTSQDRRVEITGPVDRKMIINALNSGANVFMADFEDANSPTWDNILQGQLNLRDAVRRTHRLRDRPKARPTS